MNFAERVCEFTEEDESLSSAEKVAASEGHRSVLRLLYQLCPSAAPKSQPAPLKACDFEGLYAPSDTAPVAEGAPTLFHRVAKLREEHQARFRAAAEAGKVVASALPSRRRDRGCCSDPAIESSTTMNPSIPRLVGALSNRCSLSFSFEEAARVESLCSGMLAAQSSGFWFFSALLHWLKELGFEAPDPSLFGQLVQEVSGSLVTAANSASGLAAFMLAKRREGVLSHFPSHVGAHFKKDLVASSFGGPHVFDDEVLARVIAASREDSHLDAQLTIAKAFTLPVFRAEAKNTGRKASSSQSSSASSASTSGFSGERQGLGFRRVKGQGFFSRSLLEQEVSSPWLFPCFQAGKRPQVKPGSLPSGHRRLPVPPVVRLEGQGCGALGVGSLEGGVCDSLSHASASVSDSHHPGFVLSPVCQGEGFGRGDSGSSPQGSGGAYASDSGLLQPHVCCDQGYGGLATDHQPVNSEPECGSDSFSDGDISDGSACCPQEQLDGFHRSEGCVHSDSDPPCVSQVSQVHSRREDLAVPGPLLWSVHSSTGVHSCDGTCVRIPPSAGNPNASVSGRLADSCVISGGSLLGKGQGSQPLSGAGNCQLREVDSHSISDHCLLGNQDRLTDFPGFGYSLEDKKVLLNSRRISVLKGAVCEVLESLARPPRLSVSPSSDRPASNESFTISSWSRLRFSGRGYPGSLGSSFSGRSSVVVHRGSSRRGDLSSPELSRPNVLVRCLQPRLGGYGSRPVRFRRLAGGRGLSLDQPMRVVGRRERSQGSLCLFGRSGCRSLLRQHDRGGVSEKALNAVAQRILRWAEQLNIILMPQFVPGRNNVVADALSRPDQVLGLEWMLHQDVFNWLCQRWPVRIDLFASSLSHRCYVYFAPVSDPMAGGTDAMLQSWDSLQAYAFPPFAMISQVLAKVRASRSLELMLIAPFWPQRPWFPELLGLLILPPLPLPSRWDLLHQPHVRRFHQNLSMLRLHAWRLSRDSREPPASLVAWLGDLGRRGAVFSNQLPV